jgi:uncharacterized cupredoxin-like copper-binding protein
MDRLFTRVAAVALALLGAAACSSSSSASSSSAGGTSSGGVSATEKDFEIDVASSTAPVGSVTFNISNEGPSTHEFVIIKTDDAPDALPTKNGEVNEDGLNVVDEQEDIAPSTTATITTNLDAGSYVIICNVPGHYQLGMHTAFTAR